MIRTTSRRLLLCSAASLVLFAGTAAQADTSAVDAAADSSPITNGDDIVVTATKVNTATPITSSIHTFEPQSIVSHAIIENSIPPTADYAQVVLLTPGASLTPSSGNGVGLGDQKITLRGFKDGQYNITYDGIPFGDSNDPTHHSTSYFPDGTYERLIVDRGPGAATDLGQSSYGGNVHLISREATDKAFVEGQTVYGSFNTYLERVTVNSGSIAKLGGLKVIAVGEYKQTDGALSNQPGWWANGYVKLEKPLGDNAQISFLANYNQSLFDQSDAAGGTTLDQQALYGRQFGATTAANPGYYPNARQDWNWQNKTTDMEIGRLTWHPASNVTVDNKWYTYFYKNFTVSTEDSTTLLCSTNPPASVAADCKATLGTQVYAQGKALGGGGGKVIAGDIAGYTKLNQYRTSGDILQVNVDTGAGILKVGTWYEYSHSKRYRYDYDFTSAAAAGGISQYNFNFATMNDGLNWNWKESDKAYNTQANGQPVPDFIKYDEHTSWEQIEGFGEFDLMLLADTLTITPGVKAMSFTRSDNSPVATQSSRIGSTAKETYDPVLPYFTVNYLIRPNVSAYAQFAKGFIIPSLGNSLETKGTNNAAVPLDPTPTKTTNYQVGYVYAGNRINIDADAYYIEASNSTAVDPTNSNNVILNGNPAHYKGAEGQISYVITKGLTGIANATVMSSKDAVTGLWLTGAPNYTALLGAVYNTGRFKLSYLHKITGRQWITANTSTANYLIPAYSYGVLSGSVTYGRITAGVSVSNLLGTHPITAQSGAPSASTLYIYQAPTAYQAQLKFRF